MTRARDDIKAAGPRTKKAPGAKARATHRARHASAVHTRLMRFGEAELGYLRELGFENLLHRRQP